ncbi:isochorismatase family protein [Paracoccus sp. (in: a-proteobacteria)]|uniref:isochorismatase family protein n=1 Tax=Paracoccus sp. TaxID=267 RepID=UPI0026E0BAFB|nr:isochorismatase family protein [Paracoccus sp. (in: a-proteobacteria)]MDO5648946.1 isochorismatase family protein [Paracoccus sp. (in: a-proteobacteria)]
MIKSDTSLLLVIDFQTRLMPAIHDGAGAVDATSRLMRAAGILSIPCVVTEQYPKGLGRTIPDLPTDGATLFEKTSFGACGQPGFLDLIPADAQVIVTGCESHVCVLQTVLELLDANRRVYVVADGVGSRAPVSKDIALRRMAGRGAELVTAEMVMFEWLQTAQHPHFRTLSGLIK